MDPTIKEMQAAIRAALRDKGFDTMLMDAASWTTFDDATITNVHRMLPAVGTKGVMRILLRRAFITGDMDRIRTIIRYHSVFNASADNYGLVPTYLLNIMSVADHIGYTYGMPDSQRVGLAHALMALLVQQDDRNCPDGEEQLPVLGDVAAVYEYMFTCKAGLIDVFTNNPERTSEMHSLIIDRGGAVDEATLREFVSATVSLAEGVL